MRKILPFVFAAAVFVTSCSPSPEKISEKILQNEPLSEKEYEVAIDYANSQISCLADTVEKYKDDFGSLVSILSAYNVEHPEANIIMEKLLTTDPSTLDDKNREEFEKLRKNLDGFISDVQASGPAMRVDYDQQRSAQESLENAPGDSVISTPVKSLK